MAGGFTPKLKHQYDNVHPEAEFLASEDYTAKRVGITLAQSLWPTSTDDNGVTRRIAKKGTLVGPVTSAGATLGKDGPYDAAATDGRQTITDDFGYLFETVDCSLGDVICGLLIRCSVLSARVIPAPTTAIKTGLKGRVIFQ
jgi:hypothetical protein